MSMSVVSGVVTAGSAIYGASQASGASKTLARKANQREQEMWEFEQERYEEWKDTYGGIEDNLSEYYNNLTPELRTVQGLEAFEKEKELALTNLREDLAQRGIGQSGIAAQTNTEVALSSAAERARIRAAAPMETAKEQLSFLQVGMGQNPADSVSSTMSNLTNSANQRANSAGVAAGQARQSAIGAITDLGTTAYDAYQDYKTNKVEAAAPVTHEA